MFNEYVLIRKLRNYHNSNLISNICLITQLQLIIDQVTILLNFNLKCQFSKKKIKMTLLTIISPKWIPIEQIECCSELFVPVVYRLKNFFWTFVLRWVDLKNYIRIFICLKIDLVKKKLSKNPVPESFVLVIFESLNGCKTVGEFWHLASFGSP